MAAKKDTNATAAVHELTEGFLTRAKNGDALALGEAPKGKPRRGRSVKRGNNEGSVYQRADGRWAGSLTVPVPGSMRRSRKTYYGKTRAEVAGKLTKALRDLQMGIAPANERTTVGAFLTDWIATTVKPNKRLGTYRGYERNVRCHIVPALGTVPVARLTPAQVRAMLKTMSDNGLSPRSVQYVRATLRVALKQAVADGLAHRNVAELVQGPAVKRKPVSPLTPEQVGAFLAGVRGDRLEGLYVTAFTMGLRQSELLGLRWQDVDFDAPTLRVMQTLERGKGGGFGLPKTDKSRRVLYLPTVTATALRTHRTRQIEERLRAGHEWRESGLVFTTHIGTALDHANVRNYFQRHLARLGLPHQRFHDMRHACASFLLTEGVPLKVVQEVLGHSQISLTADTYAHVMPALQREAMAHFDRAYGAL